ncbi:polysaccharide deacetylase family protein [Mesorhizobium mediterraneum]|uniref:polysaccharide deacetylase family protein n=1 Tax=Mesorhizobium mediterraneum TaxID=43617 RepID=UPI001780B4EF|nr:polysaccharide deacetylase family protein [Mesorhizobium mediterraneum]
MLAEVGVLTHRQGLGAHAIDRRRKRVTCIMWWLAVVASGLTALTILTAVFPQPFGLLLGAIALLGVLVWADGWMREEGAVPILTYHSVSANAKWLPWAAEISVNPEVFERHLQTLRSHGVAVMRTSDLIEARRRGAPLPQRAAVIHLDDGYLDNWVAAVPLLRRFAMPATMFVSLDFIEPQGPIRPTFDDPSAADGRSLEWEGYANWTELEAIAREGLVDIQSHGLDHGRVEVSAEIVDRVSMANWRQLAWVQWRSMTGPKCDWFRSIEPPSVPVGTLVRRSDGAFAARAWSPAHVESEREFDERVRSHLRICRQVLSRKLSGVPTVFCWPQNLRCQRAVEIAYEEGYHATTGGKGENRREEDPRILSRVHIGEQAGGRPWLEAMAFLATVRTFQGNLYWYFPLFLFHAFRWLRGWTGRLQRAVP